MIYFISLPLAIFTEMRKTRILGTYTPENYVYDFYPWIQTIQTNEPKPNGTEQNRTEQNEIESPNKTYASNEEATNTPYTKEEKKETQLAVASLY